MMDIQILLATHKKCRLFEDPVYLPVAVGTANRDFRMEGYVQDDTGDNISEKNSTFCELTALYWGWKNLDCAYIGLAHYRRYFGRSLSLCNPYSRIARMNDFVAKLKNYDVVLPFPRMYFIETNYSQYCHAHHEEDLIHVKQIMAEMYPEYLLCYEKVMNRTWGHRFNMLVMRKDILNRYCQWLFSILFELEKRLDISGYNLYDQRVFGFISERLLDCWLEKNNISYCHMPVVYTESQHWGKKIYAFLQRKFFKKKNGK